MGVHLSFFIFLTVFDSIIKKRRILVFDAVSIALSFILALHLHFGSKIATSFSKQKISKCFFY
ncbi:hypothetical protein NC99_26230 [Sunxiuqinia dokdonensis]|uniref:Uncharacterized protein n=1 Tax=Sunxiuqinia dokdonensis TaxID=1409788 RepID=A0A0L8V7X5_9BACT|nr:hypothetical protein NC99_26230 [Sunxiuqinia dokdonensis]